MGFAKNLSMDIEERGYGVPPDKYVREKCFKNLGIKKFIINNVENNQCSYCNREEHKHHIAVHIEKVIDLIVRRINKYYSSPDQEIPYDNEEGNYMGKTLNTEEVLNELGLEISVSMEKKRLELSEDIIETINEELWTSKMYGDLYESDTYIWGGGYLR